MFRIEVIRVEGRADSRLMAFFAAIVFLPGVFILGAVTLFGLMAVLVLALALTLVRGTIPGWWLAYAPRFICVADHASYTLMTGRRPDYRLEFAPLDYDQEKERRVRSAIRADATITDRAQLWRPRPKTPGV